MLALGFTLLILTGKTMQEDELQKIISKPVVGIEGIAFVPYTGMPVFAYRGQSEVNAKIVHVFN